MRRLFCNSISVGLFALLLSACGGGSTANNNEDVGTPPPVVTPPPAVVIPPPPVVIPPPSGQLPIPDNRYANNYQILLVGNSHVSANNLAGVLQSLLQLGTGKTATATVAPGWRYLDDRLSDGVTLATLQSADWSHVIWQAQKYSTTGLYTYPTTAAEYWIAQSKLLEATPILFPEHPRQGNTEEGMRVYLLHMEIAGKESSCVAPMGPAWDTALMTMPDVSFHTDGNHASMAGTFLTALLFYQIISGESADALPFIPQIALTEPLQNQLRQIASATLQQHLACAY